MSIRALNWAFDVDLEPSAKIVLLSLADHADDTGQCWPSQQTLAKKTSQSVDSVQRRLKELERLGFITHTARRRASHVYQLLWGEVLKPQTAASKDLAPQITVKEPQIDVLMPHCCGAEPPIRTTNIEPPIKIDILFDRFWSSYPKREGSNPKKPAHEKFKNLVTKHGADPEAIVAGAEAYRGAREGEDPRFTAMAITFLNQRRWEDESWTKPKGGSARKPTNGRMTLFDVQRDLADDGRDINEEMKDCYQHD